MIRLLLNLFSDWLDFMWPLWSAAFSRQCSRSLMSALLASARLRVSLTLFARVWMEVFDWWVGSAL